VSEREFAPIRRFSSRSYLWSLSSLALLALAWSDIDPISSDCFFDSSPVGFTATIVSATIFCADSLGSGFSWSGAGDVVAALSVELCRFLFDLAWIRLLLSGERFIETSEASGDLAKILTCFFN